MFSGIIETIATIVKIEPLADGFRYTLKAKPILKGTKLGDSIAHDGICLTVMNKRWQTYQVEVMKETIEKTSLSSWQVGGGVNVERALAPNQRNGGHQVTGHIDGVGKIISMRESGIATVVSIGVSENLSRYMIEKGSVAVDGISLTLTKVTNQSFEVWLIPHTKTHTTLMRKHPSDLVNIEVDVLAKYIEKFQGLNR
jgi:riboflavin synthase